MAYQVIEEILPVRALLVSGQTLLYAERAEFLHTMTEARNVPCVVAGPGDVLEYLRVSVFCWLSAGKTRLSRVRPTQNL